MRNYKAVWTTSGFLQEYKHRSLTYMINLFKDNNDNFIGNWIPRDAKLGGL